MRKKTQVNQIDVFSGSEEDRKTISGKDLLLKVLLNELDYMAGISSAVFLENVYYPHFNSLGMVEDYIYKSSEFAGQAAEWMGADGNMVENVKQTTQDIGQAVTKTGTGYILSQYAPTLAKIYNPTDAAFAGSRIKRSWMEELEENNFKMSKFLTNRTQTDWLDDAVDYGEGLASGVTAIGNWSGIAKKKLYSNEEVKYGEYTEALLGTGYDLLTLGNADFSGMFGIDLYPTNEIALVGRWLTNGVMALADGIFGFESTEENSDIFCEAEIEITVDPPTNVTIPPASRTPITKSQERPQEPPLQLFLDPTMQKYGSLNYEERLQVEAQYMDEYDHNSGLSMEEFSVERFYYDDLFSQMEIHFKNPQEMMDLFMRHKQEFDYNNTTAVDFARELYLTEWFHSNKQDDFVSVPNAEDVLVSATDNSSNDTYHVNNEYNFNVKSVEEAEEVYGGLYSRVKSETDGYLGLGGK